MGRKSRKRNRYYVGRWVEATWVTGYKDTGSTMKLWSHEPVVHLLLGHHVEQVLWVRCGESTTWHKPIVSSSWSYFHSRCQQESSWKKPGAAAAAVIPDVPPVSLLDLQQLVVTLEHPIVLLCLVHLLVCLRPTEEVDFLRFLFFMMSLFKPSPTSWKSQQLKSILFST